MPPEVKCLRIRSSSLTFVRWVGPGLESNAATAGASESARPNALRGGSSARLLAGRLVEVRVVRLVDIADVERLNAEVHAAIRRAGPGPAFVYGDHRAGSPVARDVADAWSRGMRDANCFYLEAAASKLSIVFAPKYAAVGPISAGSAGPAVSGRENRHPGRRN